MSELHFFRIRHKDSGDPFIDPESAVTVVMRQAITTVLDIYRQAGMYDFANKMASIFYVFYTKLEEDPTSLDKQLAEFYAEIDKVQPTKHVLNVFVLLTHYFIVMFSLYTRRDSKADKELGTKMKISTMFEVLSQLLLPESVGKLKEELADYLDPVTLPSLRDISVDAVCRETQQCIPNIKEVAARHFTGGAMSWDEAAKQCDQYITKNEGPEEDQIAASLAYPTYENPTAEIIQVKDDVEESDEKD